MYNLKVARGTENPWGSSWSMRDLMKGKLPLSVKRKFMDMRILLIPIYNAQSWSLMDR